MIEDQIFQNIRVNSLISGIESGIHSWLNICRHVASLKISEIAKGSVQELLNDCTTQEARPNVHRPFFLLDKCKHLFVFIARTSRNLHEDCEVLQWLRLAKLGLLMEREEGMPRLLLPAQAGSGIAKVLGSYRGGSRNRTAEQKGRTKPFLSAGYAASFINIFGTARVEPSVSLLQLSVSFTRAPRVRALTYFPSLSLFFLWD